MRSIPISLIVISVFVFIIGGLFFINYVSADDPSYQQVNQLEEQIAELKAEIDELERRQTSTLQQRENTLNELRKIEISIKSLDSSLNLDTNTLNNLEFESNALKKN